MPVVEAATVAGWVVSPIIKELVGTVKSTAVSQYKNFKDFSKRKKHLERILEQLQDTVDSVHAMSDNDTRIITQLMDAIHEVQDIFDVFKYREIVSARMHKGEQIAHFTINSFKKLIGRDKAFSRLKDLVVELQTIHLASASHLVQLKQLQQGSSAQGSTTELGGLLTMHDKFFGYNKEYDQLVAALLNESPASSSRDSRAAHLVAVIGHSGTGKTAIAQRVCSDKKIEGHFGPPIWVSVSPRFSKKDLLDQVWKSIPVDLYKATIQTEPKCPAEQMSIGVLQQEIRKIVTSKRCLLVLDGVFNDVSPQQELGMKTWKEVLAPFQYAKQGSKILMTTQAKICVKALNAGAEIKLNGISTEEMVLLLKEIAFKDEHKDVPDLEDVLRRAAAELKGLPSAAKDCVKKVWNKQKRKAWEEVLENNYCNGTAVISSGKSIYRNLEQPLRYCLAFCSIFPRNWKFEPEALLKMWIAHGIISDNNGSLDWKGMQKVGREYIKALESRSLFQQTKHGKTTYFVIHEHVHSELLKDSENNGFFRMDNNREFIPRTARYLSVTTGSLAQLKNDPDVVKKLRTLLVFDGQTSNLSAIDNDVLRQLRAVRFLDLAGTSITELPEVIGKLKHLRYLGLPKTIKRLPATVTNLLHLQTLAAGGCEFDEFPADSMNKLVNLRHLDVHMRYIDEVVGIGEMKNLQGPLEFCADKGQGHDIKELAGMSSLQGSLSIKGLQAVAGKEEAQKAQLEEKSVDALNLEWGTAIEDCSNSVHDQVLEGLRPPSTITELHIVRYQGTSSPSWLAQGHLDRLRYLYLINCRHWKVLPTLGQLPNLEVVHFKEMESVERIGNWFFGSGVFESLKKLVLDDMPNLVEWTVDSTGNMFPRLHEINILNCPKLEKLPQVPATVKNMRIQLNDTSYLNLSCSSNSNSYRLEICGDAVRLLHEGFLHQNHVMAISALNIMQYKGPSEPDIYHLAFVRSLSLSRCVITDRQLSMYLMGLQSLEKLAIFDCSELQVSPPDAVLSSLKSFEVKGCCPALMESLRASRVWTRICSIPNLDID